jgi:hypothetical protein
LYGIDRKEAKGVDALLVELACHVFLTLRLAARPSDEPARFPQCHRAIGIRLCANVRKRSY